jgi:hypothetical protein
MSRTGKWQLLIADLFLKFKVWHFGCAELFPRPVFRGEKNVKNLNWTLSAEIFSARRSVECFNVSLQQQTTKFLSEYKSIHKNNLCRNFSHMKYRYLQCLANIYIRGLDPDPGWANMLYPILIESMRIHDTTALFYLQYRYLFKNKFHLMLIQTYSYRKYTGNRI